MKIEIRDFTFECSSVHPFFGNPLASIGRNLEALKKGLSEAIAYSVETNGEFCVTMFDEDDIPHEVSVAWQQVGPTEPVPA